MTKIKLQELSVTINPSLDKVQTQLYIIGKIDCLKAILKTMDKYGEDVMTKQFILDALDEMTRKETK